MKKTLRGKLSYANVISTLCLFLLVGGGTAFAAGQLGKNSVGSKQLKKESVTAAKIKNGAVTGAKVDLTSLGTVPSATNATNATNAINAANATKAITATTATSATKATNAKNAETAEDAKSLDGFAANELGRAATEMTISSFGPFETSAFTDVLSKTVTAPANGLLLVWGSFNFNVKNGSAKPAKISVRAALDGNGATLEANGETTADVGTQGSSVSTSGVVPITEGTHTVSLQASQRESVSYIEGRTLTTLFVPFGNSGEQGVLP